MAKKPLPKERETTPNKSPKTANNKKNKTKKTITTKTKNEDKNKNKVRNSTNGGASKEEIEVVDMPSSSTEQESYDAVETFEDGARKRSTADEDEEEENETLISMMKKGRSDDVKSKGKKRSRKEDDAEAEEKSENNLCMFPMNRVSQIIKGDNPDIKLSKEAVFIVTRASEKFLQVFCREAYACSFLDDKKVTAYNHLSSVVSRRRRLNFLSDFIPEMVKAEDALAQILEAEK